MHLHPSSSSALERRIAVTLRWFLLWLTAYIAFRMLFPFTLLGVRVGDLTVGEFLMTMLRVSAAGAATIYLLLKGLRTPPPAAMDRTWCERWSAIAFGVLALLIGSVVLGLLERKGIVVPWIRWVAIGVLSLLY